MEPHIGLRIAELSAVILAMALRHRELGFGHIHADDLAVRADQLR